MGSDSVEAVEAVVVSPGKDVSCGGQNTREEVHVVETSEVDVLAEVNEPDILPYNAEGQADQKPAEVPAEQDLMLFVLESAVFPHHCEQFDDDVNDVEPEKTCIYEIAR